MGFFTSLGDILRYPPHRRVFAATVLVLTLGVMGRYILAISRRCVYYLGLPICFLCGRSSQRVFHLSHASTFASEYHL